MPIDRTRYEQIVAYLEEVVEMLTAPDVFLDTEDVPQRLLEAELHAYLAGASLLVARARDVLEREAP